MSWARWLAQIISLAKLLCARPVVRQGNATQPRCRFPSRRRIIRRRGFKRQRADRDPLRQTSRSSVWSNRFMSFIQKQRCRPIARSTLISPCATGSLGATSPSTNFGVKIMPFTARSCSIPWRSSCPGSRSATATAVNSIVTFGSTESTQELWGRCPHNSELSFPGAFRPKRKSFDGVPTIIPRRRSPSELPVLQPPGTDRRSGRYPQAGFLRCRVDPGKLVGARD